VATADPISANRESSSLSHPRCAAQHTTAGPVIDRRPVTNPIPNARRKIMLELSGETSFQKPRRQSTKTKPTRRWPGGSFKIAVACYAAFFACLTFAQRALCAAAILLRAATDSFLRRGFV
jgi:hypothetical protein